MNSEVAHWRPRLTLAFCIVCCGSSALSQKPPTVVINDVTIAEPVGGSAVATFTVSMVSTAPHGPVIVFYTTAAGSATAGSQCGSTTDFVTVGGNASVTLSPTEQSKSISIAICPDARDEPDQTFLVNVTARGATVQDAQGQGTIIDDDPPPVITLGTGTLSETTTAGGFTLTIAGMTDNVVTVKYATVNLSATGGVCGTGGADFERTSTTFTDLGNQLSQNRLSIVLMKICDDSVSEGAQQFEIRLSDPANATIQQASGVVTISDDEPVPTLSITPSVLVNEPGALASPAQAVFTVTLSGPATELPVTAQYSTQAGTASAGGACGTASADFVTQTGTLTFPSPKSTQKIQVPICGDAIANEVNETFTVTLVRAAHASITQPLGRGVIH